MIAKRKRVLTGSRPSGPVHVGNYFGAFGPALKLAEKYELFFFLADLHALNSSPTSKELLENSLNMVATMLALGLEPDECVFYSQSGAPEVNELAWMLSCIAPYGFLTRAHSFKDAQAKNIDVNMGVFEYPLLMAADILLYDADIVPVGQDQKQHLEMTRDFATRFNNKYGNCLTVPEPLISEAVAVVPGTDGEKMSSSKGNVITLLSNEKQWKKQIMGIKTDSLGVDDPKNPDTCIIFKLFQLIANKPEVEVMHDKYVSGGYGYGHAKQDLLKAMVERFAEPSEKYFNYLNKPDELRDIIASGSKVARGMAIAKLNLLQQKVGLIGRPF